MHEYTFFIQLENKLFFLTTVTHIVEKDRSKFNIDERDISSRQTFIDTTRNEVKSMKYVINFHLNQDKGNAALNRPLLEEENTNEKSVNLPNKLLSTMSRYNRTKYFKLENATDDSPGHFADNVSNNFVDDNETVQQRMILGQEEQLDMISDSIGTLKTVSRQINVEIDEQAMWVWC